MILELSGSLAEELHETIGVVVADMSSEIAATDNPGYRKGLRDRRERLRGVLTQLDEAKQ